MSEVSANLYAHLRRAFPGDLECYAIETDAGLLYSGRDLDRGTAMLANFFQSLDLPDGARIAVQVEKAGDKVPKQCHVVADLPRNTMGKVQKNLLRAQHSRSFNASHPKRRKTCVLPTYRKISTGMCECVSTCCVSLPSSNRFMPFLP